MSSNKKMQNVPTNKTKISFFNLGRSRASAAPPASTAPAKNEPAALAVDAADTEVNAAVLHTDTAERPSSSARGQIRKFTRFFRKGNVVANTKKVANKSDTAAEKVQFPGTCSAECGRGQCPTEALQKIDDLSLKEDGAEADVDVADVDGEMKKAKAATKIQAVFRGHNERQKFLNKGGNVVNIEALDSGFLPPQQVSEMKGSIDVTESVSEPSADEISSKTLVSSP